MDIKALAKSKRSHTKHHQPRKPHHPKTTTTATPSSSSNNPADIKAGKKEAKEKKKEKSLPSNWDRYQNEEGEDEEIPIYSDDEQSGAALSAASKLKKAVEGAKPKSKGADFGFLIAQAKESRRSYSPSFDDALPDFYQGLAPMLPVKGESSWERDYDFLLQDETATSQEIRLFRDRCDTEDNVLFGSWMTGLPLHVHSRFTISLRSKRFYAVAERWRKRFILCRRCNNPITQAPFLTLDLKHLAEELAKADIAKRLFIEPDILPLEWRGQDANEADIQVPHQASERLELRSETFGDLYSIYLEDEKIAQSQEDGDKERTMSSSGVTSSSKSVQPLEAEVGISESVNAEFLDAQISTSMGFITGQDTKSKLNDLGRRASHFTEQDTKSKLNDLCSLDAREMPRVSCDEQDIRLSSRFQADASEAELDMLLGSLGEAKLSDYPATRPKAATTVNHQETSVSYLKGDSVAFGAPSKHSLGPSTPAFPIASHLDDELDNLLEETFKPNNIGIPFESSKAKEASQYEAVHRAPLHHSLGPSRPSFPIVSSLDDELDNLLEETSKPSKKGSLFQSTEVKVASFDLPSSSFHPSSKSKVDDFDTWLGTL